MAKKPIIRQERIEVVYSTERWRILSELRRKAIRIMEALERAHIFCIAHGSIARGDVSPKSDIDIFIPQIYPSFTIENALRMADIPISRRILVQATPTYSVKGYIEINEQQYVSFPLCRMREIEREFYKFGGEADLETFRRNVRVPGVDKRLMLIEPTKNGHIESSIIGREEKVAKILGISVNTVLDRVHALLRRDRVGRTGLFIERELAPDESFEMVLKRLAETNPAVRRRLRES